MNDDKALKLRSDQIIAHLYDIALDPATLDGFIDKWNEAGFDVEKARHTIVQIDAFDRSFAGHLSRADKFLELNEPITQSQFAQALAPFDNSAATVVDQQLNVVALNSGAMAVLELRQGSHIEEIKLADGQTEILTQALKDVLRKKELKTRLLILTAVTKGQSIMFHLRRLSQTDPQGNPLLLVVSGQYFWRQELGEALIEVFTLTLAELGVVRGLVEGRDVKAIAFDRGTSEATVRSQIKSILSKMNARSQSEVIRLVMSLREVTAAMPEAEEAIPEVPLLGLGWLQKEAEKPFKTMILPDGRRMDYHDQGPRDGAPILFSHFGLGMLRWSAPMLDLAYRHKLRVICPVRAGYGASDDISRDADILSNTRSDTLALLDMLGIERLPYCPQGSDLLFAVDLAAAHPERVTEVIGICARPYLAGDEHYSRMGKWHRFFLSTGKHSPHLLDFTTKAAFSLGRKIGARAMFLNMNKPSEADHRLSLDPITFPIMVQASEEMLFHGNKTASQAYVMEVLASETDWSDLMHAAKDVPICSMNGLQDPSHDMSVVAQYRENYPWMSFDVFDDAGQMLIFQKPSVIIPRLAEAAHRGCSLKTAT